MEIQRLIADKIQKAKENASNPKPPPQEVKVLRRVNVASTPQSIPVEKSEKKKKTTKPLTFDKTSHIFSSLKSVKGKDLGEVAKQCGMDFTAIKKPLHFEYDDEDVMVHDKVAVIRQDNGKYLGVIGVDRPLVQYRDSLEFTEIFAKEEDSSYEYGGITHNGRTAYLVMKSNDCFEIYQGDSIDCFFYIQSSHDSSKSLMVVPTPVRRKNNAVFVHPNLHAIKIKHTKHVDSRIIQAKKSIGKVKEYFKEFEQSFKNLAAVSLDKGVGEKYFSLVFPASKENSTQAEHMREKVTEILTKDPSLQLPPTKNTLLGAYFAIVYFCDHYMTVKKTKTRDEISAQIDSKISIAGASAKRKAEALATGIKLATRFAQ